MSNPITTTTTPGAWSPDLTVFEASEVIGDALVLSTATVAGRIEGDAPQVRVAYIEDDVATFTAEGAEIDQAAPTLGEKLVSTGKVATITRVSREQFLQAGTSGMLSDSMRRSVIRAANQAYLTQPAPVSPDTTPPAGILTHEDIEIAAADIGADLDPVIDLVATLEANGATPSGILVAPDTWAAFRKVKTGEGAATSLLGVGASDAQSLLLGLPVQVDNAVPAGTGFIYDRSAIVAAAGPVEVATSDDVYFTSDSVAVRCVFRFGALLVRPDRVGTFQIDAG